jgi:hypothetical protein
LRRHPEYRDTELGVVIEKAENLMVSLHFLVFLCFFLSISFID